VASDISASAGQAFSDSVGARAVASNMEVAQAATVLVLAVKPSQAAALLADLAQSITEGHLLLSIAAGVPLRKLEEALFEGARVIRVMPNTPALIGASASAYALGRWATAEDAQTAQRLFSSVGLAFQVEEKLLDAVTGLSGSGPAYVYMLIEALSDGGVAAGLPRDIAHKLAAQTVFGSAKMVLATGSHPGVLKDMVASPGGTTIQGIHELERAGFRAALMNAVCAAAQRARELGHG
jgi:pyrroline-5-carboxylate reductase